MSTQKIQPLLLGRLIVVETVYHQERTGATTPIDSRFSRQLDGDEQTYVRKLKIGEKWEPLDLGWVKSPSMIVVSNEEGKHLQSVPSTEEKVKIASRVLVIGIEGIAETFCRIRPGESARFEPSWELQIRCLNESASVIISAVPS